VYKAVEALWDSANKVLGLQRRAELANNVQTPELHTQLGKALKGMFTQLRIVAMAVRRNTAPAWVASVQEPDYASCILPPLPAE